MTLQDVLSFQSAGMVEEMLIDVAGRIQLTRTKHAIAVGHYQALCSYVDRPGSPLHKKVITSYPSGSFGIGAVIASRVRTNQHDLDVVLELDLAIDTPPAEVLRLLHDAIQAEDGSRYHDKVKRNSRCVTVEYDDGFKVDLMPVVRDASGKERRGVLFHSKGESAYTKKVNPYGFKTQYNATVETDPAFVTSLRKHMADSALFEKADVEPMDGHVALEEKSPRTVALQLLKRLRDVRYRKQDHRGRRAPPSIVLASFALLKPNSRHSLLWELIDQIKFVRDQLEFANRRGTLVDVRNPAWSEDRFTDRWPADLSDQELLINDLADFEIRLETIARDVFSSVETKAALKELFGETAATFAIEEALLRKSHEADRGELKFGRTGRLLTGTAATAAGPQRAAARPSTDFGNG